MSGSPSRFGPYELVQRLGAGGMAETFLAVRRGPGAFEHRVCVKRILPAFEQDADFVRQFLEEARVSAQLRHANIVQVLDFGVADSSHYLALELVEGMDLHKLLRAIAERHETMTSGLVVYLATELATALEYAHGGAGQTSGPVVHRDISPSNVLVSRAGEVKLTDFGIAKAVSQSTALTTTGVVKGKVPYMAPEYALSGKFEARSDLFALGVLLYEALAGRRPFVGQTDLDTLQKILEGKRPPLAELCPSAPRGLVDAIERLLDPNPERRFANAADLLDGLVDVAPPPTARRILGDLVRRLDGGATPSAPPPPREATMAVTGAGRAWSDPAPTPAGAGDATRTRAQLAHEAPPTVQTSGLEFAATIPSLAAFPPTELGPSRAPSRASQLALAAEETRELPAGAPATASITMPTPALTPSAPRGSTLRAIESVRVIEPLTEAAPKRSVAPWVGGALAVAGALAIIAVVLGAREQDPTPTTQPQPTSAAPPEATAPPDTTAPTDTTTAPETAPSTQPAPTATVTTAALPSEPAVAPIVAETERDRARPPRAAVDRATVGRAAVAPIERPAEIAPRVEPPAAPGSVRVVVLPFGEVWIDGQYVGSSPITRALPAGPHLVEAGPSREERTHTRRVTLDPGEDESVTFR